MEHQFYFVIHGEESLIIEMPASNGLYGNKQNNIVKEMELTDCLSKSRSLMRWQAGTS
jgi:hypothetical protein